MLMFSASFKYLSAAAFLFAAVPAAVSASENLFLKGTVGSAEVMVRLTTLDANDALPRVFGGLGSGPYAYSGAYYSTTEANSIETCLVAQLSPNNGNTLNIYSVIDGKRQEPPWATFILQNAHEPSQESEWKGTSASSAPAVLQVWRTSWEDFPELNSDYNAPRLDAILKREEKNIPTELVFAPTGIKYSIVQESLTQTAYPRLVDYPDTDIMTAVNEQMVFLQRNLMMHHLGCMANGRSTPGQVENRTQVKLLTRSILSASMHYKYTDPNPDSNCADYMFPDPLNVALRSPSMAAGEILALEDMFTQKALNARILQQYAWKKFSQEHSDDANDCRNDFSKNPDAISLTFTESGALFELALDNDRAHCSAPVTIESRFLRRMVLEGSPLESLWPE